MQSPRDHRTLAIGLVGSLPPPLGGVTILFEHLVNALKPVSGLHLELTLIPCGHSSPTGRVLRTLRIVRDVWQMLPRIDVLTLHVPTPVLPILGPICLGLAKLRGKRFIIRKFGGTDYRLYDPLRRALCVLAVNRCDAYLAEARELVEAARSHGAAQSYWYPNNRPLVANALENAAQTRRCYRYLYVGQVRYTKGVFVLADAAEALALEEPVDIYGPLYDGISADAFRRYRHTRYRGVIEPGDVLSTLRKYDALVLPTYHDGEGYPGVILEAYCAGLPVICTRWRVLPELVDEDCGLLVPPRDRAALQDAMLTLQRDVDRYNRLRQGAIEKARQYSTENWAQRFVDICAAVMKGDRELVSGRQDAKVRSTDSDRPMR